MLLSNTAPKRRLCDILPGQAVRVLSVDAPATVRRRLLELGLIDGTRVRCVGKSPCGDPRAFMIRGAVIVLRLKDTEGIAVCEETEWD